MRSISRGMVLAAVALAMTVASCREQSRTDALAEGARLAGEGNAKGAVVVYKSFLERDPEDRQVRFELAKAYFVLGKSEQALREAERLAALADPPEGIRLLLGKALVAEGRTEEGLKELSTHLARNPDAAEAWEYVGHAHARGKELDEAAAAYEHSLSLDRSRTNVWIELISTRILQNRLAEAQTQVEALLAAHPDDLAGLHLLAQIQTMNRDIAGALATYGALKSKYPKDVPAIYNEAFLMLATQGMSEKIAQTAVSLIKDFPTAQEGYKLQGLVDLSGGAAAEAITNFAQAIRLRSDTETHFFLAQAYEQSGSQEMAVSELRMVLDAAPAHSQARKMMVRLNLKMDRTTEAIDELNKLLEYHPDSYAEALLLGDILLSRKEFAKSLAAYGAIPDGVEQSGPARLKKSIILGASGKTAQAEAQLRATIGQNPAFFEPRVALAALLNQQQRLDEAMAVLTAPGLGQTDAARAGTVQASILVQQGRVQEAMDLLEKAKTMHPKLASVYTALAKLHAQRLEPDKAMEQYRQLLVEVPDSPAAHMALAMELQSEGDFEEAQRHLEQAAASRQLEPVLRLVTFLNRRNQTDKALEVLHQSLQGHDKSVPLLIALARTQEAAGDEANCRTTLEKLEAVDQKAALAERLRLEMGLKHWDQAEEEARRFIALAPGKAAGYLVAATVKKQREDAAGTEALLRKALEVEPGSMGARLELASFLMQAGKADEAAGYFDEAIAKSADPAEAYGARGLAWQAAGKTDAAIKDYEAALRLRKNMPMVLNNLSMIYADKPDAAAKGLEYAMAAHAMVENNAYVLDTLGYVLLKNGRAKEAAAVLRRAAALEPQNREIARHLEMASSDKN